VGLTPRRRLRRPPYLPAALVLVAAGIIAILAELQSPSALMWTGVAVRGYTTGGITYYSYHGVEGTLDNPHQDASVTARVPTTVYLDPDNPADSSKAMLGGFTRWVDAGAVLVWFLAAIGVIGLGYLRRARTARRRDRAVMSGESFGYGLDPEVVKESLRRRNEGT